MQATMISFNVNVGTSGIAAATAGVTGTLVGGNLVMPNDVGGVNYSDQGVTSWGSGFRFVVTFSGPLVSGTGGTDPSGFYVLLYDSGFGSLGSTLSQGEAANLIFNTDGTTVASTVRGSSVIGTPEPGSLVLGGISGLLPAGRRLRK